MPGNGANLIVARRVRESYPELGTLVTLFCDEGGKYISEHFAAKDEVKLTAENYT